MIFFTSINRHMFREKVFQTMVFSRYVKKVSHCYKNFELKWSFKYSKNTIWYLTNHCIKNNFLYVSQTPPYGRDGYSTKQACSP
jgi:hypothetical protein